MDITKLNNIENNKEKDYIHKGNKVFPSLDTAILANLRGFMNGSYPSPFEGPAKELGYYPLSMANEEEMMQIEEIKQKVLGENYGKDT